MVDLPLLSETKVLEKSMLILVKASPKDDKSSVALVLLSPPPPCTPVSAPSFPS